MGWLKKRLKEKSTYRGLAILLSVAGVGISPDMLEAVLLSLGGALGLIEVVTREAEKDLKDEIKDEILKHLVK